ncbi:hypothetical protein [Pontibacillus marinus]|uniref:Membrane protein n=1 Tax=Pontibacillus marinus BH030004 = DSM 16465 TaxID=1385511 RepID=A0A0A5HNV8_9BACI|nr:hypothetical protein [Pontibacillus marinus]KGX85322.1 membrane protein [Pontibacillus marinus BH030004 = DSM 16465]
MAHERKTIIIDEIKYWKEHQLLPKEYCDFLLALYTEGNDDSEGESKQKHFPFKDIGSFIYVLLLLSLLPLSFLVIHFTELSMPMQTGLILFFIGFSLLNIWFFYRKNSIQVHVAIIVFLLILFLYTSYLASGWATQSWLNHAVILLNCMLWIGFGIKQKLTYLIASGFIGIIIWCLYIFF